MIGCISKQLHVKPESAKKEEQQTKTEYLLSNIKTRQDNLKQLSGYLSELESQLALVFAASPDIIVLLDKNANILKISDAVFPILGYNKLELVGKNLWEYLSVPDIDKTKEHLLQLQKGKTSDSPLVNCWIAKNGQLVKLIWRLSLFDEKRDQIIGIASDITSLDGSDNYQVRLLQKAVNLSTDGVVVTDSNNKTNEIIYVNDAFAKMSGYSQTELIGKNAKFLQSEECKDSRAITTLRQCIKEGRGCDILLQNVRKNGEIFYNKISVSAVKEGKETINHIWISKDVTDEIGIKYEWSPYTERGFYYIQ